MVSTKEQHQFYWSQGGEPHVLRRKQILAKYGDQVRKLYGYDHSTAVTVSRGEAVLGVNVGGCTPTRQPSTIESGGPPCAAFPAQGQCVAGIPCVYGRRCGGADARREAGFEAGWNAHSGFRLRGRSLNGWESGDSPAPPHACATLGTRV